MPIKETCVGFLWKVQRIKRVSSKFVHDGALARGHFGVKRPCIGGTKEGLTNATITKGVMIVGVVS